MWGSEVKQWMRGSQIKCVEAQGVGMQFVAAR